MDSKDNFLKELNEFLYSADEDYLISISNKGTYKRTLKDMEGGLKVEMELMEGCVRTRLSDESECTIIPDIKGMKCSCPSRNICKHIIASLIYLKDNIKEEPENEEKRNFDEVLNYNPQDIIKTIGQKNLKEILYRIQYGIKAELVEDNFFTVNFRGEDISVRFPYKNSISQSICTCKEKEFCIHRGEAILQYKIQNGIISVEDLIADSTVKIDNKILDSIENCIEDILSVGLSRLPNTIGERLQRLALVCQSEGLASFQKLLRALNEELSLYFSRNAAFTGKRALTLCNKIYNLCQAIRNADIRQLEYLIGEQKSNYFRIPPTILHCIAAESWVTQSGYEGITIYFWNNEKKQWFTYTRAQANYYENTVFNARTVYYSKLPWKTQSTFKDLEGMSVKLSNLRINKNRRITSSEEVKLEILEQQNIKDTINSLECSSWNDISSILSKQSEDIFFKKDENYNLFIVKPENIGVGRFDEVRQVLELPIVDILGKTMLLTVKYSEGNKKNIHSLEKLNKEIRSFFIRSYLENGLLKAFPITIFYNNGRIFNLTLD